MTKGSAIRCRSAGRGGLGAFKPEFREVEFVDEHIDHTQRVVFSDPVVKPPWQYRHGPTDGPVKKSRNDICHAPGSSTYQSVKYFTPWDSLEDCLASGGRLPGQR